MLSFNRFKVIMVGFIAIVAFANITVNGLPAPQPSSGRGTSISDGDYANSAQFEDILKRLKRDAEQPDSKEPPKIHNAAHGQTSEFFVPIEPHWTLELYNNSPTATQVELGMTGDPLAGESSQGSAPIEGDEDGVDHNCAICLETMEKTENYKLDCGHEFHKHCLIEWKEHDFDQKNHPFPRYPGYITCVVCRQVSEFIKNYC